MFTQILQVTARASSPIEARIALLALLGVFSSIYILRSSWLNTNTILFSLPIQRFKWQSENLLSSRFNRYVSAISASIALSIYLYTHWSTGNGVSNGLDLNFYELLFVLLGLFFLKHYGMKLYFLIHEEVDRSSVIIDYQSAYNQILTIGFTAFLCFDIFFLKSTFMANEIIAYIVAGLIVIRLAGSFVLLLNHFNRSFLSLFIYLCAFEIAPMLLLAKVLILKI